MPGRLKRYKMVEKKNTKKRKKNRGLSRRQRVETLERQI